MNGAGMLLWQNIFGSWNGWTDRDLSILRSMLPIQKHFNDVLTNGEWTPLVDCSLDHVYATQWKSPGATLYTLVNRNDAEVHGSALAESAHSGARMFDLVQGVEIDHAEITIRPRAIGAIAQLSTNQITPDFERLLESQAKRYAQGQPPATRIDPQIIRQTDHQDPTKSPTMLVSQMRVRECGDYTYFPQTIYPGLHQVRNIQRSVQLAQVTLDPHEVTNRQYQAFLTATQYKPAHPQSFLKHWQNGAPRPEDMDKPVVYIDLNDARAYAKWAGQRLPTEDEWQAGVQSTHQTSTLWNWTESEHTDAHTTFSILKGTPPTEITGSAWYADNQPTQPTWSAKYIHFYPSLDRCDTIGFRCSITIL